MDHTSFDQQLYMVLVTALLGYTRAVLTTVPMAQHVLTVMNLQPRKILYLSFSIKEDYMTDTLLHGFKKLLGQGNVVDVDRRVVQYRTLDDLDPLHFAKHRNHFYGFGYSYACRLFEADGVVDRENIPERIRNKEFQAVVFGGAHRGNITTHPLYKIVCANYPAELVAAVWGGDGPPTRLQLPLLQEIQADGCISFLFSRELYD